MTLTPISSQANQSTFSMAQANNQPAATEKQSTITGPNGEIYIVITQLNSATGQPDPSKPVSVVTVGSGFGDDKTTDLISPSVLNSSPGGLGSLLSSLPVLNSADGSIFFNKFVITEDGNLLAANSPDGSVPSADSGSWVNLGPVDTEKFPNVLVGVPMTVTGDSSGYDLVYDNGGDNPLPAFNELEVVPTVQPYTNVGGTSAYVNAAGEEFQLPAVVDETGAPIEFDAVSVVEVGGQNMAFGLKKSTNEGGLEVYQSYSLGAVDAPVGEYTLPGAVVVNSEPSKQFMGTHTGTFVSDGGKKETRLLGAGDTGTATSPVSQGSMADVAVVTEFYDESGTPLTYYLDGEKGGASWAGDQLKLPGSEGDWELQLDRETVGDRSYNVYVHKETGTRVYAAGYEEVGYFKLNSMPPENYAGKLGNGPGKNSGDQGLTRTDYTVILDENNTGTLENPVSTSDGLDYFHVDQFLDSEGAPITYYIDGGKNWNQIYLPGEASEWEIGSTTQGHTVYTHKATGSTVYAEGADSYDVIYVGYGEDAAERSKHVYDHQDVYSFNAI
jgi:hypothetical protein